MVNETSDEARTAGLWLRGEFLSAEQLADQTKPAKDGSGTVTYRGRFVVKMLVGDRVYQVEYKDREDAFVRIPLDVVARGDVIEVPLGVRSAQGYTFYYGR